MATRIRSLLTYSDLVDHLTYYMKANPSQDASRDARRAIQSALDELSSIHSWSYLTRVLRLNLVAPYETGTIAYDHSGGSVSGTDYGRLVTLSSGTFPSWTANGVIVVSNVAYGVSSRIDGTHCQLEFGSNLLADVASGTSYSLYRDTYTLPSDLVSIDQMQSENSYNTLEFIHPRGWLRGHRHNVTSASPPAFFTIMGDRDFMGVLAAYFYPYPSEATTMDAIYRARPRPLEIEAYQTGTVTITLNTSAVIGIDTIFTDDMIGSVIRVSSDADDYPTGLDGANPFTEERVITGFTTSLALVVDRNWNTTFSTGVKYRISDPVDIEFGSMTTALLRLCEQQLAVVRRLGNYKEIAQIADDAVTRAMETDSRSTAPRSVGTEGTWHRRLASMPSGADVE